MTKFNLEKIDSSKLSNEIVDFGPIECMECEFDGPIPIDYFLVTPEIETEKDDKEVQLLIEQQLGYKSFNGIGCGMENGNLISVCRCPKCGSEDIFQDF